MLKEVSRKFHVCIRKISRKLSRVLQECFIEVLFCNVGHRFKCIYKRIAGSLTDAKLQGALWFPKICTAYFKHQVS